MQGGRSSQALRASVPTEPALKTPYALSQGWAECVAGPENLWEGGNCALCKRAPVGGEGGWTGSTPSLLLLALRWVCAALCPAGLRKGEKGETLAHMLWVCQDLP